MPKKSRAKAGAYRMLVGGHYAINPDAPREKRQFRRFEAGDIVNDFPADSVTHWLENKMMEPAGQEPVVVDEEE